MSEQKKKKKIYTIFEDKGITYFKRLIVFKVR